MVLKCLGVCSLIHLDHETKSQYSNLSNLSKNINLSQDVIAILVSFKNDEDPIKNKGTTVLTLLLNIIFSNTQGQLPEVGSGRNWNRTHSRSSSCFCFCKE